MFIDPEPKRQKAPDYPRNANMSSGFFSSQKPVTSPRDLSRRKALHEQTKSDQNQLEPGPNPEQPTVRLVNSSESPSPPATTTGQRNEGSSEEAKENWAQKPVPPQSRLPRSAWIREAGVSNPYSVSDTSLSTNEEPDLAEATAVKVHAVNKAPSIALLPTSSVYELPRPAWHRRSTSTGDYSQSSTLQDSEIALSKKSARSDRFSSFSQLSTLAGSNSNTPTPYEQDHRDRAGPDEDTTGSGPAQALQTLQEASPERPEKLTTIRAVPPSDTTSSPTGSGSASQSREGSPSSRSQTARSSDLEQSPSIPRISSRRSYSTGSVRTPPSHPDPRDISATIAVQTQQHPDSQSLSEASFIQASSPNFIAYSPDSIRRPISQRDPLRSTTSFESINTRLQDRPATRRETTRSLANSSSWASFQSTDTLPSLYIPKKRLRHKAASESLASQASSSHASDTAMATEDIDTLPYPKRPFSTHLSTIASESDRHSRGGSQHLSHFSLGSGVLTGDDASSQPQTPATPGFSHRRRGSAPVNSIASSLQSPGTRGTQSSEFVEEAGDMTLGVFREESAIPQPLFRANAPPNMLNTSRTYDGPLPPLPPIPNSRDSDEDFDTLSALQTPPLREKRSGYSLRRRSNSTPENSRQQSQVDYGESERNSQGSSIFPVWAKHFYTGTAVLSSKASLNSLSGMGRKQAHHKRNKSSYTDRSITSRLGTGYSNVESTSPTSSRFLPEIFRSHNRKRQNSQRDSRSSKIRKSGRSKRSQETRRDSMAINADPLPQSSQDTNAGDILPSGQPKWGVLKDKSRSPDPRNSRLVRKYSKQRLWDTMEFPRPMTKDRLSDFGDHMQPPPHLEPSKRSSQYNLSAWRAPSFVESLHTLIDSRCNRQILLFMIGFVFPLSWMLGAVLPLPKQPVKTDQLENNVAGSEENVQIALMKHEAGDAERRGREEKMFLKARWWRLLNRIMSVVGLLVIGAVIALAIVATR